MVEVGEEVGVAGEEVEEVEYESRVQWGDSSKLLFQPGYLKVLKELALSGQLQLYNIRGVCWRLFLGCLPEEHSEWEETTRTARELYDALKKKHIVDPHMVSASLDIAVNNPLSQADNSPWHQFFVDTELRQMIDQDVVRTFPDVHFFRQQHIQDSLLDILFCYAKEHSEIGYRQGMHELLAPIMFVLHAEMRDVHSDTTLAPILKVVMDPDYIEHDAFTIFSELMECVQPWYMITALEVDNYRIKSQNSNKMMLDPRTRKPFEQADDFPPTSAISRKLDVIHQVLLKRADHTLYAHLKELSIPAQTYGIRWIRLLFGREFPLPSVLELWDALFADGPSLALVDYICVAMLMHIREVLVSGDYTLCMQHLMRFPNVYEVNYLVQRALHLRSPRSYSSPHIWEYKPTTRLPQSALPPVHHQPLPAFHQSSSTGNIQYHPSTLHSRAAKAKHVLATATKKALSRPGLGGGGGAKHESRAVTKERMDRSPSPSPSSHRHTTLPSSQQEGGRGRGRGRGFSPAMTDVATANPTEMISNPKSNPSAAITSSNRLERITNHLDHLEAKCQYCGSKMESLLASLQEEVTNLTDLSPDAENTIFLSIAGLKHVRDLLLKKIPFSGETAEGWEMGKGRKEDESEERDGEDKEEASEDPPLPTIILPTPSPATLDKQRQNASNTISTHTASEETDSHPLPGSGEGLPLGGREGGGERDHVCEGVRWEGGNSESSEEWVSVNVSHPLNGD